MNKLTGVPHVIDSLKMSADRKVEQWFETEDQVDGGAHVVMANARFCIRRKEPGLQALI
jgi:hypothetical protein